MIVNCTKCGAETEKTIRRKVVECFHCRVKRHRKTALLRARKLKKLSTNTVYKEKEWAHNKSMTSHDHNKSRTQNSLD